MSSTIYNHRSLQPTGTAAAPPGGPPAPNLAVPPASTRFDELLDTLKHAYDDAQRETIALKMQRDEYEAKINAQVNELNHIRQSLYELEATHKAVRLRYEDEFQRLTQELANRPVAPPAGAPAPPAAYPSEYEREREDREREREHNRERDRIARERERELRDRERESQRDSQRDRDRADRDRDMRPADTRASEFQSVKRPVPGGSTPRDTKPSAPPASIPPTKTERERPADPANKSYGWEGNSPTSPPRAAASTSAAPPANPTPAPHPEPMDLEEIVNPDHKKEGGDWFAVFNPKAKRAVDVSLTLTLAHESVVCCVRFSQDGKYLATGCNRSAQIYDTKTGAKTCVLIDEAATKTGDLYIRSVCFSPDGKYLATGAEDKQIRIWDIAKKRIQKYFEGHTQEIYSLDFSRDGRLIVSGSGDKTARIWDMETGSCKVLQIIEPEVVDAGVTSVAISPDGRLVAAGSLDTIVRIWETHTGNLVERLRGHQDSVYSVAFTPDGRGLVSGSLDKSLKYWDLRGLLQSSRMSTPLPQGGNVPSNSPSFPGGVGRKEGGEKGSVCTTSFLGHKDYVLSVAVSPDNQWIVSGSKDRGVQFWDPRSATQQLMLQGHKNSVISIDLSPAGGLLATGSGDWQARVWSYAALQ
ncbi:Transcriptional repressor rco-1 OS=Neurospora crassa (strain ATCC 24698 / 74-OR23-1A / CBS 708,71 / DSM 1257 / FGSC 987) GN=rco-1 PE=4 SV=2 [Rhizoctonia solani AG-1 IB]|uniref:Transcriptional repressor rco-1 n=1 Tax=Thanatephorus cucumeris (strain AG1-IB / isolate 7/3/14) TaxID=1108050 RepID=A0A0B7FJ07_THACB|nr:Transcriptional repressor rco-1 OS=Neurospora crassa (strain ATCC 24698 / 74-OR23-1A / CBS 708,71 / DSM 1257 / FGSC 987) GN=rco-1 PE=4 SV=2 [Rhizoctonia solani AG-1 IB]